MTVHVLTFWHRPRPAFSAVDTTASSGVFRNLSPFVLGPVPTYGGRQSRNMENAWQFSKVYPKHAQDGEPTAEYYRWRDQGWADRQPLRYPMGKGSVPEFSLWDGEKLGYVDARKRIYALTYAEAVEHTESFEMLLDLYHAERDNVVLLDYDAYDHLALGMSLVDVINNPKRKMGHAFVLGMMLEGSLKSCLESPTTRQLEMNGEGNG